MNVTIEAQPVPLVADASGTIRVVGSRVTLDTVVGAYQDGSSVEEIVQQYPSLRLADVHAVIAYYLRNEFEVNTYLAEREAEAREIRKLVEQRCDQVGIRERLQKRMALRAAAESKPNKGT